MKATNVERLVAVSSVGANEAWPPMMYHWVGPLFSAMLMTIMRKALKDVNAYENAITDSGLDYVLVRPVGLDP